MLPDTQFISNAWSVDYLSMLAVALLMTGVGVYSVVVPGWIPYYRSRLLNRILSWGIVVLGGILLIFLGTNLIPGANGLILSRDGFAERILWKDRYERWDNILSSFTVEPVRGKGASLWPTRISYRVAPEPGFALTCCISSIQGLFGRSNEDLAKTLNAWRDRAISKSPQKP